MDGRGKKSLYTWALNIKISPYLFLQPWKPQTLTGMPQPSAVPGVGRGDEVHLLELSRELVPARFLATTV